MFLQKALLFYDEICIDEYWCLFSLFVLLVFSYYFLLSLLSSSLFFLSNLSLVEFIFLQQSALEMIFSYTFCVRDRKCYWVEAGPSLHTVLDTEYFFFLSICPFIYLLVLFQDIFLYEKGRNKKIILKKFICWNSYRK